MKKILNSTFGLKSFKRGQQEIIQSVVKDDGVYMIGDAIVQVTGGVPKRIA